MAELIPGIPFDFGGGRVYTIPPLTIGAIQRLQTQLSAMGQGGGAMEPATVNTVLQATHAALRRNYPDLSQDDVAELVDLGNMHEVIACVMDVAGIKRKAEAEAKNPTAQALTPPPGPASSSASAPTPDGLPPTSESTSTFPPLMP